MHLNIKPGSGPPRLWFKDCLPLRPVNVLHTGTAGLESRIPASTCAPLGISAPLALGYPLSSSMRLPTPVNKPAQEDTWFQSRRQARPEKLWGWAPSRSPPARPAFPGPSLVPGRPCTAAGGALAPSWESAAAPSRALLVVSRAHE